MVLLTDGEETCGRNPCALAKSLKAVGHSITVHVISYRMRDFSWTGGQGIFDVQCLARETGGEYIAAESIEDLVAALNKTLDCPMTTHKTEPLVRLATDRLRSTITAR